MSPNCRSASTSTTGLLAALARTHGEVGGDHRLAGAALGGEHRDDLAAARRSGAPSRSLGSMVAGAASRCRACPPTRSTARPAGRGRPERQHVLDAGPQRLLEDVGGELVRRRGWRPTSGRAASQAARPRPTGPARPSTDRGPRRAACPVSLAARASIDGKGTAWVAELHGQPGADHLVDVDRGQRQVAQVGPGGQRLETHRAVAATEGVAARVAVRHRHPDGRQLDARAPPNESVLPRGREQVAHGSGSGVSGGSAGRLLGAVGAVGGERPKRVRASVSPGSRPGR